MQGLKPKLRIQFGTANESLQDRFTERQGGKFLWRDRHRVIFQSRAKGLASISEGKFEVVVLGVIACLFDDSDCDRWVRPGGRDHGFETDLRMCIVCQTKEMTIGFGKIISPVTKQMRGGRPAVIIAVGGDSFEELRIDPAPLLMEPEGFGEVVSMVGVCRIERSQPFFKRGTESLFGQVP